MNTAKVISQYESLIKDKKSPSSGDITMVEKNCRDCLKSINEKLQMCIKMFNSLSEDIGALLKREFPYDQSMSIYSGVVGEIVKNKPTEPISFFATNVYSNETYRKYINEGNDKFFLGNSYEEVGADADSVKMMFEFKNCWEKMDVANRDYIKNVFKTMVKITAQYIEEKYNGNQMAAILTKLS